MAIPDPTAVVVVLPAIRHEFGATYPDADRPIGVSVVGVVADFADRSTPAEATVGFMASMVTTAGVTALALLGVLRGMPRRQSA